MGSNNGALFADWLEALITKILKKRPMKCAVFIHIHNQLLLSNAANRILDI
jgi:hypothetical protein